MKIMSYLCSENNNELNFITMAKSFISFIILIGTILFVLVPVWIITFGFLCGRTFMETAIIVSVGLVLLRLFRPISVIVGNDNLKF